MKVYKGQDLVGLIPTYKLDGVQAIYDSGCWVSRSGKPLYNLDHITAKDGDRFEVFCGTWESTITAVRTKHSKPIPQSCLYMIWPTIDSRLVVQNNKVSDLLDRAVSEGHEGIVFWSTDNFEKSLKWKPEETYDVPIIDIEEGSGRNVKRLGAFLTSKGKVGTGLTDKQRDAFFNRDMIGKIIEVKCMSLTKDKKFRHPVFVRLREDKSI